MSASVSRFEAGDHGLVEVRIPFTKGSGLETAEPCWIVADHGDEVTVSHYGTRYRVPASSVLEPFRCAGGCGGEDQHVSRSSR